MVISSLLSFARLAANRAPGPLDFAADQVLDDAGQIVIKPHFQNWSKHFAHHIFKRPRVVQQDSLSESVESRMNRVVSFP